MRKAVPGSVLDQHRYERTHPARIQEAVFLLDHVFYVFPGQAGKLCRKPVHHITQRPQLFAYSHRESVWDRANPVKGFSGGERGDSVTRAEGMRDGERKAVPRDMDPRLTRLHPPAQRRRQCGCSRRERGCRIRPGACGPAVTGRYSTRRFSIRMSRRSCLRAFLSGRSMADRMVKVTVIQRNAATNTKAIPSSVFMPLILSGREGAAPRRSHTITA